MQQMILQTIPYQPSLPRLFKPNSTQKQNLDDPSSNQEQQSLRSSTKMNDDSIMITPFDRRQTMMTRHSTNQNKDDEAQQQWPQIQSILKKIHSLQLKLKDSRRINQTLKLKIAEYEEKILAYEQLKTQGIERLAAQQENKVTLHNRIKQLEVELSQKQNLLADKQHLIEEIQFAQIKKRGEYQQKIKKMNTQSKQLMDKLRKSNNQLQKQRRAYKQLKESITSSQMQQMNSQREQQLVDEIHKLKQFISISKEQKEMLLYQEIDKLSRQLYLKQEQIRRKNIQLNLCDRKKHQAVCDIVEKKDAEMKVQKLLFKSLNQKMLKLQQQIKSSKNIQLQLPKHPHRFQRATTDREQEISFHLSPDKQ